MCRGDPEKRSRVGSTTSIWRGNAKQAVYLDDVDRWTYLRLLGLSIRKRRWRCLAYCLMDNHVHLLLETPHAGLAVGMQWLHGVYAQTFNERHGRVGHLFQGRYGSVRVTTDAQLWALLRYVGVNPVEAGLCASPSDWRWRSMAPLCRIGRGRRSVESRPVCLLQSS